MILEQLTYNSFGYFSYDLSAKSHKRIITSCDGCGLLRIPQKKYYRNHCWRCASLIRWSHDKFQVEPELLWALYHGLDMNTHDISELFDCSQSVICQRMIKNKIPKRSNSESHKGLQVGDKNPNWRGGITPLTVSIRESVAYAKWRTQVFERDDYICQSCGNKGYKLNVHHLYNFIDYPVLRLELGNGITLCEKCHLKFHKLYGKKNNIPEQFEMFINNEEVV